MNGNLLVKQIGRKHTINIMSSFELLPKAMKERYRVSYYQEAGIVFNHQRNDKSRIDE